LVPTLLLAAGAGLAAQATPAALQPDAAMPLDELELRLKPLSRAELSDQANAWRALLQAKVAELSDVEIRARRAASAEISTELSGRAQALRGERGAIAERFSAVLEELLAKGGDVSEHERYVAAVTGIEIDIKDTNAALSIILNWLISPDGGLRWLKNIVFFIASLLVFRFLAKLAGKLTDKALVLSKTRIPELLRSFFANSVRNLVFFIGFVVALSMIEVNVGPFLAAIGAAGFVIGFALQGTLSNFAAGVMILLYRPYDLGDFVTVGGVTGKVDAMSLVATTLKTPDNQVVIVPNGSIWGNVITNVTGSPVRRVDLTFGVSYGDDLGRCQRILEEVATGHPLVLKDPAPEVKVSDLAESAVNFVCRPWTRTSDYWKVRCEVTQAVKERFDREGITIPFPQREVHVRQSAP
jgi:small conductance mechanosensitive channel